MVDGLKLRIEPAELREHCIDRAAHHRDRAKLKAEKLTELREIAESINPQMSANQVAIMNKTGSYQADPKHLCEQLETDIRDHNNKALAFEFFANHLFDDTYTLAETDLMRLEILRR